MNKWWLPESGNASRCPDMMSRRFVSDFGSVLGFFNTLLGSGHATTIAQGLFQQLDQPKVVLVREDTPLSKEHRHQAQEPDGLLRQPRRARLLNWSPRARSGLTSPLVLSTRYSVLALLSESALGGGVVTEGTNEVNSAECRPIDVDECVFGIGGLPQQEARHS